MCQILGHFSLLIRLRWFKISSSSIFLDNLIRFLYRSLRESNSLMIQCIYLSEFRLRSWSKETPPLFLKVILKFFIKIVRIVILVPILWIWDDFVHSYILEGYFKNVAKDCRPWKYFSNKFSDLTIKDY